MKQEKQEGKKIKIAFLEQEHRDALNKYEMLKSLKSNIQKELQKLNNDFEIINCSDVINEFYSHLERKHKTDNKLNLKGQKLSELMEYDLTSLTAAVHHYLRNSGGNPIEVDLEDFVIYAETPIEIERYNSSIDLIVLLRKFVAYDIPYSVPRDWVTYMKMITWCNNTNDFIINHNWIKSN